jgi:mono/diheme cytochrome c family protein/DNA uptake protein ComE-like DNA-binding protein
MESTMTGLRKTIWLSYWVVAVFIHACWAQDVGSTYAANCANCHGADGRGNTALGRVLKLRDLRSPEVQTLSENELLTILSKGTNGGKMPGFQKKLGSDAIRELAAYVRTIDTRTPVSAPGKQLKASARDFDPRDVKSVYSAKCAHCHGVDGSGDTILGRNLKLQDMRSAKAQNIPDDELVEIIAHGTDHGRMPGFRKKLGDEIVRQLASYVRGLADRPPVEVATRIGPPQTSTQAAPSKAIRPEIHAEIEGGSIVRSEKSQERNQHTQAKEIDIAAAKSEGSAASIQVHASKSHTELVDLNSASKEVLTALPGITDADADRIIAGRPYKSSLQFKTRGVVSSETYAKIAGHVVAKKPTRPTHDETH